MWKVLTPAAVLAGVIVISACGGVSTTGTSSATPSNVTQAPVNAGVAANATPAATPTPSPAAQMTGQVVSSGMTSLGTFLVDSRGITLYLFEADKGTTSTCYGDCAQNWPPLLTHGTPVAQSGVNQSLLGTTARTDGTTQVTYNSHPLYFFVADQKPGDTNGEGVNAFGGGWDVVATSGNKIEGDHS